MTTFHNPRHVNGQVVVDVVAENAPLGVQLWPTISERFADNFTLSGVAVVRTELRTYVLWTYRNGTTRTFDVGEQVAASIDAEVFAAIEGLAPAETCEVRWQNGSTGAYKVTVPTSATV